MSNSNPSQYGWKKKKSISFSLPYWKDNLLHHNLDVMHIEKNICDNILVIIINLTGQSKDTLKARLNLHLMGIRSGLHPTKVDSSRTYISPACFILNVKEKHTFCKFLKGVKVLMAILQTIS